MSQGLEVWVRPMDGEPVTALGVLHVDAESARVRLPGGSALEPTTEGLVGLVDRATGSSAVIPVVAGWPEDDGEGQVCDLFFIDGTTIAEEDARKPRRRATRVVPAPGEVAARVHSDRPGQLGWTPIEVVDLSVGGMAVEIALGQEPTTPFTHGLFEITVPGETPRVLGVLVRNRSRRTRELVRFGLEFDPVRTDAFEDTTGALARWVARKRAALAALASRTG